MPPSDQARSGPWCVLAIAVSCLVLSCSSGSGDDTSATTPGDDGGGRDSAGPGDAATGDAAPADAGSDGSSGVPSDDLPFAAKRAACAFKAGAAPGTTFGPSIAAAKIPIDTFVLVVQENRSFDHYFSMLPAAGQSDVDVAKPTDAIPGSNGSPVARFHQPLTCFGDMDHSWNGMHSDWDTGKNDGFVRVNDPSGSRTLGYYDQTDIPFYYALATAFGTSDRYFSPTLTSTGPNRLYLYAATSLGVTYNATPSGLDTIFQHMVKAGITWKVYRPGNYSFEEGIFPNLLTTYPGNFKATSDYLADAQNGTLPNVSFLYAGPDEHPPHNMQQGEVAVEAIFLALAKSPQWKRSAFVLTYDEAGGLYDHAPPPAACAPDNVPPQLAPGDAPGGFDRYGFRVPIVVASAWSKPHYVSHVVNDHTSILRLIELKFGLGALTARDANANALFDLFDFTTESFPTVPAMPQATVDQARFTASGCQ